MLSLSTLLVKEQVSFLRLSDTYDILDPATGQKVGQALETNNMLFKLLRLLVSKQLLPSSIAINDPHGITLFYIKKGPQILRAKVQVLNSQGVVVGYLKSKLFSLGGGFFVYDTNDKQIAEVKGDWKGWNFKFIDALGKEIGTVTKKWAGLGKELFTSADNYMISLTGSESNPAKTMLLLAAGLAIDLVYKENT